MNNSMQNLYMKTGSLFLLVFFCLFLGNSQAQNLFPIYQDGKYGYMDATGKLSISLQFDDADFMEYGVAVVDKNGKKGLIDSLGNTILPFKFKKIKVYFSNVFSTLDFENKSKIVNRKREVLEENIPYRGVQKLRSNKYVSISRSREQQSTLISAEGELVLKAPYSSIIEIGTDTFQVIVKKKISDKSRALDFKGWIRKDGSEIIPVKYRQVQSMPYQDFISLSGHLDSLKAGKPSKKYLTDGQGNFLSDKGFTNLSRLSSDFVVASTGNAKLEVINKKGEVVFENSFHSLEYIEEYNIFIGRDAKDGLYRIYDEKGKKIGKYDYHSFDYLKDGTALVCKSVAQKDGETQRLKGVISVQNEAKVILPFTNDCNNLKYIQSNKYFKLTEKNEEGRQREGILSVENERLIPSNYQRVSPVGQDYFIVQSGLEEGMVNGKNEIVIPLKKQKIKRFIKASKVNVFNLFKVEIKSSDFGKYTQLANFSGMISDRKYSIVSTFDEAGQAKVQGMEREWGIIDSLGNTILPLGKYGLDRMDNDAIEDFWTVSKKIDERRRYGTLNRKGNLVVPMEYDNSFSFREGTATVKKDGKMGLINAENEVLIPCEWESVSAILYTEIRNQFFFAQKEGECVIFNKKGELLTARDKYIGRTLRDIGWYGVTVEGKTVGYYNADFEYITLQ